MIRVGGRLQGLFFSYELFAELGCGGYGRVFQAGTADGRERAIKVLEVEDPDAVRRFQREMRLLGGIRHDNIIEILDYGTSEGRCWYAMPRMEGDLQRWFTGREYYWEDVLDIIRQVALGLHAYHRRGGIHRDIKLENILMDENGIPVIADFGLGRCPAITGSEMTRTCAGTPGYMAPEVWRNEVCAASDVYALGIVMWELVNEERHQTPAKPPRLSAGPELKVVEELYKGMTHPDPSRRPSAKEVARSAPSANGILRRCRKIQASTGAW